MEITQRLRLAAGCLCAAVFCVPAYAGDTTINGFLRAAAGLTSSDEPQFGGRIDRRGSADETHFGLNIARELDNKWSVAGQMFATGGESDFRLGLDWAYLTYRATSSIKLNAGKIKYPNLMVSEYYDVGIAYPWIRPPQEVYAFDVGGRPNLSLESFTGGMAVYDGNMGNMDYALQVYSGNAGLDMGKLRKMMGMKFKVGTEAVSVVAGYNMHSPENTVDETGLPAPKNGNTTTALSAGLNIDWNNLLLLTEFAQGSVDKLTDLDVTAYYATLGYRIGAITPHVTYATLDAEQGDSSITAGVKFQLSPSTTMKMEYQQVTPKWKTGTAPDAFNIYSGAIDMVF